MLSVPGGSSMLHQLVYGLFTKLWITGGARARIGSVFLRKAFSQLCVDWINVQVVAEGESKTRVVWPFMFGPEQVSIESWTAIVKKKVKAHIKELEELAQHSDGWEATKTNVSICIDGNARPSSVLNGLLILLGAYEDRHAHVFPLTLNLKVSWLWVNPPQLLKRILI